jgi:hypothetical protein
LIFGILVRPEMCSWSAIHFWNALVHRA